MDTDNNDYYLLISGRWFHAPELSGPWTFVQSSDLPAEFRRIPANGPAAPVLTAVAGTPQAKEAVIANSVPQTAVIPRKGGPALQAHHRRRAGARPIEGTPLQYVWNSPDAIILVNPTSFYALRSGVWFTARSLSGPWLWRPTCPTSSTRSRRARRCTMWPMSTSTGRARNRSRSAIRRAISGPS